MTVIADSDSTQEVKGLYQMCDIQVKLTEDNITKPHPDIPIVPVETGGSRYTCSDFMPGFTPCPGCKLRPGAEFDGKQQ